MMVSPCRVPSVTDVATVEIALICVMVGLSAIAVRVAVLTAC